MIITHLSKSLYAIYKLNLNIDNESMNLLIIMTINNILVITINYRLPMKTIFKFFIKFLILFNPFDEKSF